MKTITINLYTFGELAEDVRKGIAEKKCFEVMNDVMDAHGSEYEASLKAFEKATGFGAHHWSVGYYEHRFDREDPDYAPMGTYDYPLYADDIKGRVLWRWCYRFVRDNRRGNYHGKLVPCEKSKEHPVGLRHVYRHSHATMEPITGGWTPWTGVCTDCPLVEPIVDFYLNYHRGKYGEDYSLADLIDDCLEKFFDEWESEYNAYGNNEHGCVEEDLANNEYSDTLFLADGTPFEGDVDELESYQTTEE